MDALSNAGHGRRLALAALLLCGAAGASETTLYSAGSQSNRGKDPDFGGLVQAADGNYYGATQSGGAFNNCGTLFRVTPAGVHSTLHFFGQSASDGCHPQFGVSLGKDGNLYGTTNLGGTSNQGTLFSLSTGGVFTTLASFVYAKGYSPSGGVLQTSDGALYGTCYVGGSGGAGTVWRYTSGNLSQLYGFDTTHGGGANGNLVQGSDGLLYGVTYYGGASNMGTAFKLTTGGTLTILHSFSGGSAGSGPSAGLVQASDNNFYGTTARGGDANNDGTVFRVAYNGAFATLHLFSSSPDGAAPHSELIQASDGKLYGTTVSGGANTNGSVYSITTGGAYATVYSFDFNGYDPQSALLQGTDGKLYGTTTLSSLGGGTVYQLSLGSPASVVHVVNLNTGTEGWSPYAGLSLGSDGSFYGADLAGGPGAYGSVFRIAPDGTLTTLVGLAADASQGANPYAAPIQGSDGNLYGTTVNGGGVSSGTLYKIALPAGTLSVLHSFSGGSDGFNAYGGLLQGSDAIYGTTRDGGDNGNGSIFKLTGGGLLVRIHSFDYNHGGSPYGNLILVGSGPLKGLYMGTTSAGGDNGAGTIYTVNSDGSSFNVLYSFDTTHGAKPLAGVVQGVDGNFYGTTSAGGNGYGTVYSITPAGAVTTLYAFNGGILDGGSPGYGALLLGSDGNFYGTTQIGGSQGYGTAYRIKQDGSFGFLYAFQGSATDGGNPEGGLVQAPDSYLYGTASVGGQLSLGTVFRLDGPPLAPTALKATGGSGQVSLQWNAAAGATGYNIFQGTTAGGEGATAVQTNVQGTSFTVTGLNPSTKYYFKVAGLNALAQSLPSAEASAATAAAPPAPPATLTATPGVGKVTLSWPVATGATSYKVFQGTTPGGESATPVESGAARAVVISGLTNGTTYYFTVASVNAVGTGAQSMEASAKPGAPPAAPTMVTAVGGNGQATLSWHASTGATGYSIYQGTTAGGESATPVQSGITSTSAVVSGLTNGSTYYFKISASSPGFTSALSAEVSVTPLTPPAAPAGVVATPGTGQVSLNWNASAGATSYSVYQGTSSGGEGAAPVKSGLTGTNVTITGLTNGTTYFFKIVALNGASASAPSAEVSAKPVTPPTAPTGVTATAASGKVTLSWAVVSGATSYNVYQGTTAGGEAATPVKSGPARTVAITGLSNGTTYYFKIAAVNAAGTGPTSAEVSATPQ